MLQDLIPFFIRIKSSIGGLYLNRKGQPKNKFIG